MRPWRALRQRLRGSLRLRLLGGALVWVSAALVVIALMLVHLFRAYAEDDFYRDLGNDQDQIIAALSVDEDGRLSMESAISDPQFSKPYSGVYWQVFGADGALLRSRSLWDFTLRLPPDKLEPGEQLHHRIAGPEGQSVLAIETVVMLPRYAGPLRVVVANSARALDASVRSFSLRLALTFIGLGAALVAAAALQVWIGLSPLQRLRQRLGGVRRGEARRLEGSFPSEVQPLIDDLNILLDHQAEVVERARMMAGNLAHGLKTPLAVIANEASRLEQAADTGAAGLIQAQVDRMQRQIDYHMVRARAAASRGVPGVRSPVAPSVAALLRVVERLHAERVLELSADIATDAVFGGERQDFEEMLGNLVDNAAKWAKRRIAVSCRRDGPGWIEVAVEDDGPGLAADQREQAFARGHRLDEAVPGSGLGLAIVRDLAEMYGGQVHLDGSHLGGLRAVVRLPGG